jgi:uncharacterized circularly permuted ATP-grasp superfamily protein
MDRDGTSCDEVGTGVDAPLATVAGGYVPAAEGYVPAADGFDEAFGPGGPHPAYRPLMASLAGADLEALAASTVGELDARGVVFGGNDEAERFLVDPIPRIISAPEWDSLEAGLIQRVTALNAFVADVYGARAIVQAGHIPADVIDSADYLEPAMAEVSVPGAVYIGIAGLDVVRDADGELLVLEDNLRTPSGLAYACVAREAVLASVPRAGRWPLRPVAHAFELLAETLRAASPRVDGDPLVVVLSDGPRNSAWWEHRTIAERIGLPLVTPRDLEVRDSRLYARLEGVTRPVDVVYRRCDEDRLVDHAGHATNVGRALLEPLLAGRLACVNAFGTGVADDKLVHAYVEEMVRFYLGEEPLLRSVPTYALRVPAAREAALERIAELVIKPRTGHGGRGVFIGPHASVEDRARMTKLIRSGRHEFVAQEMVSLSSHPTVIDGRLAPRHVDLRPFVFITEDGASVLPGGLTRVALKAGDTVVNSSQHGGGKDTWVMA